VCPLVCKTGDPERWKEGWWLSRGWREGMGVTD
jgi:hypothetical protein